jgi:hypothetical protein
MTNNTNTLLMIGELFNNTNKVIEILVSVVTNEFVVWEC